MHLIKVPLRLSDIIRVIEFVLTRLQGSAQHIFVFRRKREKIREKDKFFDVYGDTSIGN